MRVLVHRQDVFLDPQAVYIRVWNKIVPKLSTASRTDVCDALSRVERDVRDEAGRALAVRDYSTANKLSAELFEVISRFSDLGGCPMIVRPPVPIAGVV